MPVHRGCEESMKVLRTPRAVDLLITNKCNLRCSYCSHFSSDGAENEDLPTGEWLAFFEELNGCAVFEASFGGGEPFTRDDLGELIAGVVKNRMRFCILSNGSLVTDEMAAFIASTGRCNGVQISIDGSFPGTHDVFRGDGAFERAVAGLMRIRNHRIPVTARVTIHRHNVDELERIARFLLEEIKLCHITTNSASYVGLCRDNSDEIQLSVEQISNAMTTLLRLESRYPGRISAFAGPHANAKQWLLMEKARRERQAAHPDCGHLTSCGGVFSKIAVRADGVIVPCVQLGHIELGRINRDDIRTVWQSHPKIVALRARCSIPLDSFSFCSGCEYIPYCRGNCPALAQSIVGDENHPSPESCLREFLESGGRLPEVPR